MDRPGTGPGTPDPWDEGIGQALAESEARYRILFETAGDAIFLMRDDRFVDCNARAIGMFGAPRDRIVGADPARFSPPLQPDGSPSAPLARQRIDRALATGALSFSWEHCRADGNPFHAEVSLNRLELGGETYLQAIVRDVTDRVRVHEALRHSETQLNLIVNHVSDVLFSVRLDEAGDFRFAWINRRFLEATGLTEDRIVGQRVLDVIPPPAHELVLSRYHEALRTGQPARWEEVSAYPAGTKVGQVTVVPVLGEDGKTCTQLVGMVHDITQIREAEAELRRHADDMERTVQSRTAQLAARNQELKDFAYTVSHDLKAPLRGIAGYAGELERKHQEGLGERARFCVSQILTASSHLDRLIEDLLHYSRLDAEVPTPTDIDLRVLVDSVLKDRDLMIKEQRVEVALDLRVATVRTWERGLLQVLANLVDNAMKYSRDARPPRLRIAAEPTGEGWRLSVTDNGIGFDMKYHDRIFGLFNRLVRAEEFEGTGAGLAIARRVLDKLGGRIRAESAPGQGATFIVEIPRPQEGAAE